MTENIQRVVEIPAESLDIIDRVKYVITITSRSQAQFARFIGLDPANLSKILTGRHPISKGFINRLVADAGVSKNWLLTGEGLPFEKEHDDFAVIEDGAIDGVSERHKGTPLYDVDVTAGGVELSRIFTSDNISGYVNIPGLNSESVLVRVSGDSMTPLVPDGSYIAIRRLSLSSTIAWGHVYVVVTDDYRMVKRVRRNVKEGYVTLHSENVEYDDIDMPISDIREIFIVEAVVNCRLL